MKGFWGTVAIACAWAAAGAVHAADYTTVKVETTVDRPIEAVWPKVGGFCQIGEWLKRLPCVLTSGTGDLGSVRKLNGTIVEVMVAQTRYSYTYAQPDNKILYHGTLAAEPSDGGRKTRLIYSLIYDQEPDGTQEAKDKDRANRVNNWTGALASMKALAEAK